MTVLAVVVGVIAIFVPGLPIGNLVVTVYELAIAEPVGFDSTPLNKNLVVPAIRGLVAGLIGAGVMNLLIRRADFSIVVVATPILYALISLAFPDYAPIQEGLSALGSAPSFASASAQVVAGCIGFSVQCKKK